MNKLPVLLAERYLWMNGERVKYTACRNKNDGIGPGERPAPTSWEGVVFGCLPESEQRRLKQAREDGKAIEFCKMGQWTATAKSSTWLDGVAYRIAPEQPEKDGWVTPIEVK